MLNNIEKRPNFQWGNILAQSRQRVQQVLLAATMRVRHDAFACPWEGLRDQPDQFEIELFAYLHELLHLDLTATSASTLVPFSILYQTIII